MKRATGLKLDDDKPDLTLLPYEMQAAAARAFGYGAKKYKPFNWTGGMPVRRCLAAVLRHINEYLEGADVDTGGSGLHPIDHALAMLGMVPWMIKNRPDLDDRRCKVAALGNPLTAREARTNVKKLHKNRRHKR